MAEAKTFTVTIAKVNEELFSGPAVSVTLPGIEGQLTILGNHVPLVTLLKEGMIMVRTETGEKEFAIEKGVLEISDNQVTVLV